MLPQLRVTELQEVAEAGDDGLDAAASGVQLLAVRVPEVAHDLHEAEEGVRLRVPLGAMDRMGQWGASLSEGSETSL